MGCRRESLGFQRRHRSKYAPNRATTNVSRITALFLKYNFAAIIINNTVIILFSSSVSTQSTAASIESP